MSPGLGIAGGMTGGTHTVAQIEAIPWGRQFRRDSPNAAWAKNRSPISRRLSYPWQMQGSGSGRTACGRHVEAAAGVSWNPPYLESYRPETVFGAPAQKRCPIRIRTKGCPALPGRKEPGSCLPKKRRRDRYTSPFLRIRREEPMTGLATTNRPKYWSGCEPSPRSVAKRPFPRNLRPTP